MTPGFPWVDSPPGIFFSVNRTSLRRPCRYVAEPISHSLANWRIFPSGCFTAAWMPPCNPGVRVKWWRFLWRQVDIQNIRNIPELDMTAGGLPIPIRTFGIGYSPKSGNNQSLFNLECSSRSQTRRRKIKTFVQRPVFPAETRRVFWGLTPIATAREILHSSPGGRVWRKPSCVQSSYWFHAWPAESSRSPVDYPEMARPPASSALPAQANWTGRHSFCSAVWQNRDRSRWNTPAHAARWLLPPPVDFWCGREHKVN